MKLIFNKILKTIFLNYSTLEVFTKVGQLDRNLALMQYLQL
jgi:hypothetical protein